MANDTAEFREVRFVGRLEKNRAEWIKARVVEVRGRLMAHFRVFVVNARGRQVATHKGFCLALGKVGELRKLVCALVAACALSGESVEVKE